MAKDKKMVESITSMSEDFAQWYTDVVLRAELIDYSTVRGCTILRRRERSSSSGAEDSLCRKSMCRKESL